MFHRRAFKTRSRLDLVAQNRMGRKGHLDIESSPIAKEGSLHVGHTEVSRWVLNIFRERGSRTSLGSLFINYKRKLDGCLSLFEDRNMTGKSCLVQVVTRQFKNHVQEVV